MSRRCQESRKLPVHLKLRFFEPSGYLFDWHHIIRSLVLWAVVLRTQFQLEHLSLVLATRWTPCGSKCSQGAVCCSAILSMIVGAILERSGLCKRVVHLEQSVSSSQSTRRGRMQWDAAAIDIIEIVDDAESPGPAEIVEVRSHSNSIEVVSDEESLGAPIMRSGSNKASAKDSRSHKLDKARTVRRALLKERKRQQAEMKARVMSESNSSLQRKMWQCAWPKLEKPEGLKIKGRLSHRDVAKLLAIRPDDVREYRAIVAWAALQQQSDHLNELLRKHGAWVHRQSECGQTLAQAIAICSGPSFPRWQFRPALQSAIGGTAGSSSSIRRRRGGAVRRRSSREE